MRWLAESVLPPDYPGLDLPMPQPVHEQLVQSAHVRDYVLGWARHPEEGGTFDARTRDMRALTDGQLLGALEGLGYGGLVYTSGDAVIGHLFDQQHGDRLHGFSMAVGEPFELRGYSRVIPLDYVAYAYQRPDIVAVRVGRGRNAICRSTQKILRRAGEPLGWRVDADGWVEFPRSRPCAS